MFHGLGSEAKGSPQRSFIFRLHGDCVRGGGPQNVNFVNSKSLANVAELSGRGARLFYLRKKTNKLSPPMNRRQHLNVFKSVQSDHKII